MKLTSDMALNLLKKDVIKDDSDLDKESNKWVLHSICVGTSASCLAKHLNLDSDYACALGYIHDIGRKINHQDHAYQGYLYMVDNGYVEEASICLTHSFIDNNIHLIAGGEVEDGETKDFIEEYLNNRQLTIYDNLIQLCDLLCLSTGITTLERRLLDIYTRKGVYPNTIAHYENAIKLKEKIESMLNCSIYSLFPSIDGYILDSEEQDREEIKKLLNVNRPNILIK